MILENLTLIKKTIIKKTIKTLLSTKNYLLIKELNK